MRITDTQDLAIFLRKQAETSEMSYRQIAEKVNVSRTTICNIAQGKADNIGLSTVIRICDLFGYRLTLENLKYAWH